MDAFEGVTNVMESSIPTEEFYGEPLLLLLMLKIVLCVILVVGVLTNSSIVILMVVYGFRNVSDVFIGILCTANTVFLIVFVPLELSEQNVHDMDLFFCRLIQTINVYFCALSILSLVVLSYERCCAVTRPMSSRGDNIKTTFAKVVLVIILACLLSAPFWFVYEYDGTENQPNPDVFRFAIYFTTATLYVCPLLLIAVLYLCMAVTLLRSARSLQEGDHNRHVQARRNRVSWIVCGLVVSFAVCWLPFYLFLVLWDTGAKDHVPNLMFFLGYFRSLIYTLNTCTDPLSIYLLGSRYRQNLRRAFCKKKKKREIQTSFQSFTNKPYHHQSDTCKSTSLSV